MRDISFAMWAEACAALERVERARRSAFRPVLRRARHATWEPPIDLYEAAGTIWVVAALPFVDANALRVELHGRRLLIAGERPVRFMQRPSTVYRLEMPHGHFERVVELPADALRLDEQRLTDGCLIVRLSRRR
jgi:HSP20 family protein